MDLEKSIETLQGVLATLKILDTKVEEVVQLAKAYASDATHFLKKGNHEDALEAYAISWAYIDALLHLGLVGVEDYSPFTVER